MKFEDNSLNFLERNLLNETEEKSTPFCLLGDGIFNLKIWRMRSFPQSFDEKQRVNYCHSRVLRVIENVFTMLLPEGGVFKSQCECLLEM